MSTKMWIQASDALLTSNQTGYKFKVDDIWYWISKEVAADHGCKTLESFINKMILIDADKLTISRGWAFLPAHVVVRIALDENEIREINNYQMHESIKKNKETEQEIFEDEADFDYEDNQIQPLEIDFKSLYDSIEFYEIKEEKQKISKNEKLIQKSIKLAKAKYFNGRLLVADCQFKEIQALSTDDVSLLVRGDIKKIKIKKFDISKMPASLKGDNQGIVNYFIKKGYEAFMTQTDTKNFIAGKIAVANFIAKIEKTANAKFVKIQETVKKAKMIQKETGVNPFVLAWPFVKGITSKGTLIHAPLAYRNIDIKESLNEYEISIDESFTINTYPILKNYSDTKAVVNEIQHQVVSLRDVLIEFYKHNIKITAPKQNLIHNYEVLTETDLSSFNNGFFEMSNEAVFKVKPSDEFVYYDLKRILKENEDFDLPQSTYSLRLKNKNSTTRAYIGDVDHSKATVIEESLKHSVVISGPPGTGKSETITNIIGTLIGQGKNALVVAEKATAIEVIENNLKKINFDSFVINLNNDSKISFQEKFNWLDKLIFDYSFSADDELREIEGTDFALEWLEENQVKNEFIKIVEESNEMPRMEEYIKLSELVFNTFSEGDIQDMQILEYVENELINSKKVENFKDKVLEIEERVIDLQNNILVYKNQIASLNAQIDQKNDEFELVIEEAKNAIHQVPITKIFIRTLDDILMLSKQKDYNDLAILIGGKKPLLLGKFVKDNQQSLSKIYQISQTTHKQQNELESFIVNAKTKIANLEASIKSLALQKDDFTKRAAQANKFIEEIDWDTVEAFKEYENLDTFNYEIIQFICAHFDEISSNANESWRLHKEWMKEQIDFVRDATKWNYAFTIQNLMKDPDFRMKYGNVKKHINNKLEKRGQSVIKTIKEGLNVLKYVFPALMMNPDIVSSVLPPQSNIFDYVIFDEASQMRLHKGIPSLHRGKIAIVAGDEKQLGPTDLFADIDTDEDYELNISEDTSMQNDTILNYAKDNYVGVRLKTHYRSKSKDLIQFSNDQFYDGQIMIADTPNPQFDGLPPIVVEELQGIWERTYVNEIEASRAAQLVEHYRMMGKSVGVITFNDSQAKLISDKLKELEINHLLRPDDFFIKPIKDVQGDERDVIIFSITYGKYRDSDKYVSYFGNFSKEKINVAITRSKLKMHILKSLPSSEVIAKDDDKRIFRDWLEFLENYNLKTHDFSDYKNKFRSPFEEDFFEILSEKLPSEIIPLANYNAGSKEIDVVLWSSIEKQFIGAIELDGARYHSAAEDILNDFERQMFLENMGWSFKRISFWEFYKNRYECVDDVIDHFKINWLQISHRKEEQQEIEEVLYENDNN